MLISSSASVPCSCTQDIDSAFWKLWQDNQDYLYRCCRKWMGNPTDAEDALSRAMLKAWEKARDCTDDIKNFKAWLTKLTYNLCADIHRERNRGAVGVDSLDTIAIGNETELISQEETPVRAAMQRELKLFFRGAIDELPDRLRETFILHFESGLSYPDIAEQLGISYDNVRKRISQARAILRQRFNENFGEDGTDSDLSNPKSRVSPQSAKPRKWKKTAQKEQVAGEITLSGKLEQVQIVAGVELPEAALSVTQIEPVLVDAKFDQKLEEIEIVTDGELQQVALSVPHREKLELEERMKGEKPRLFSFSKEISAFPSSSQWAIPLRRIASRSALKQLLIRVSIAWSSEIPASPIPETGFLRLLTRGARSVNKGIDST
ncbi:sigma-70 family RNA polymerase sigma factor [Microcoleus sp. N9_B2]|uniref:sigma-70 family RNA polymerase sigma factor n=1 Tax=unclassified Microcoleus TaxID=2642155 RepID=UPI002FD20CD4